MKYIQNAKGGVHAVDDDHYSTYLSVTDDAGNPQPKPGYQVLTEKQARAKNPQLFGETDANVVYSLKELVAKRKYAETLNAFREADAAANATTEPATEAK